MYDVNLLCGVHILTLSLFQRQMIFRGTCSCKDFTVCHPLHPAPSRASHPLPSLFLSNGLLLPRRSHLCPPLHPAHRLLSQPASLFSSLPSSHSLSVLGLIAQWHFVSVHPRFPSSQQGLALDPSS